MAVTNATCVLRDELVCCVTAAAWSLTIVRKTMTAAAAVLRVPMWREWPNVARPWASGTHGERRYGRRERGCKLAAGLRDGRARIGCQLLFLSTYCADEKSATEHLTNRCSSVELHLFCLTVC